METWHPIAHSHHPHGIRGSLLLRLFNPLSGISAPYPVVLLRPLSGKSGLPVAGKIFQIESFRGGDKAILHLCGIDDRTALEGLLPCEISLERANFPQLSDPDEFYVADLLGLAVVVQLEQETQGAWGKVVDFYDSGAQVVLVIEEDATGKKWELPFVGEFFPEVNLSAGFVLVKIPEFV